MEKIEAKIEKLEWKIKDSEECVERYRHGIKSYIDDECLKVGADFILDNALKLNAEIKKLDSLYEQKMFLESLMADAEE